MNAGASRSGWLWALALVACADAAACKPSSGVHQDCDARYPLVPSDGSYGDPIEPPHRTPGYLHTSGR